MKARFKKLRPNPRTLDAFLWLIDLIGFIGERSREYSGNPKYGQPDSFLCSGTAEPGSRYRRGVREGIEQGESCFSDVPVKLCAVFDPESNAEAVILIDVRSNQPVMLLPPTLSKNLMPFVKNKAAKQVVLRKTGSETSFSLVIEFALQRNPPVSQILDDFRNEYEQEIIYEDEL